LIAGFMAPSRCYVFGEFRLDGQQRALFRAGRPVAVTPKSMEMLVFLVERHGRIVDKEELMSAVWPDTVVEEASIAQNVFALRKILGDARDGPSFIETVPRRGYRFVAEVRIEDPAPAAPAGEPQLATAPQAGAMEAPGAAAVAQPPPAAAEAAAPARGGVRTLRFDKPIWGLLAAVLMLGGAASWLLSQHKAAVAPSGRAVAMQRLTDFVGLEEFPAISPDGRTVAFVADKTGRRQVWVRLVAGGLPLQITSDEVEHLHPRWWPDSSAVVYYSPPPAGEEQGSLWEVPALGGVPRRLAGSVSSADASHDGSRLAFFRLNPKHQVELVTSRRDTSEVRVVAEMPATEAYEYPRWSPDDRSIAFEQSNVWGDQIVYVPSAGGAVRPITRDVTVMEGFAWTPDGSGIIYSSGVESTVLYLPTMHLWLAPLGNSAARQVSYGEESLLDPDLDRAGNVYASRRRIQSDIWKFPVGGPALDNVRNGQQLTHQTGQVHTPCAGPGDREIAYLSDEGGHGNIWIMDASSGAARQITTERDPRVTVGLPVWSSEANRIAFVSSRDQAAGDTLGLWVVDPDGSGLQRIVDTIGGFPVWSIDGQWVYYTMQREGVSTLYKVPGGGGQPIAVRSGDAMMSAIGPDGSTLYFVVPRQNRSGTRDYEIRAASPPSGPARTLAEIAAVRVPHWQILQGTASHDGRNLALPLYDGISTNLYLVSTATGALRAVADFGSRRTFIARRVSWSSDDRFLYAAVGDVDADIVRIDGMIP
jgi:Tol biopolymer transport system component/DNA-binding winged helix-turn-helix (wHTH) protein